jgi:hypothetical protein
VDWLTHNHHQDKEDNQGNQGDQGNQGNQGNQDNATHPPPNPLLGFSSPQGLVVWFC